MMMRIIKRKILRWMIFIGIISFTLFNCNKDEPVEPEGNNPADSSNNPVDSNSNPIDTSGNPIDTSTQPVDTTPLKKVFYTLDKFAMGADLSYVNQILDRGGVYKDSNVTMDPYAIFKKYGTNLVRLRLWHNPAWTKELYGTSGTQLYNDLYDVEKAIKKSKDQGMAVELDFHYSDFWADPGRQEVPAAWEGITSLSVLKDSVYNYTYYVLNYLNNKGLMPEMVQIGNETNCGMLTTSLPSNFPKINVCNGNWASYGEVINSAIKAVRDVSNNSTIKTKIILHVADPKNLDWWFDGIINQGKVNDFEIIGFSYYPIWHTTVSFNSLSSKISSIKGKFGKDVMILETAYTWTKSNNDNYGNIFGNENPPIAAYPYSKDGQRDFLIDLTQKVIDGGGIGVIYWEPAWISSQMKDSWGTGSSWENNTYFNFNNGNNVHQGINWMTYEYKF